MKLFFVGAALLISVLSINAQHYIPDLPPPWSLRYLGSAWPSRRFGSEWPSRRFGSDWPFRPIGSEWPSRHFGSEWPFRRIGSEWPSRHFGSEWPSRRFGSEWPSRHFGSEWPSRRYGSEWPSRHFGSECPSRRFGSDGNPGFRDDVYFLKSILHHSLRRLLKPFISAENPGYWDDVSFRKSISQRLPFCFPRSFGSTWPFRHFGSADRFSSEKQIHMLGKLIEIYRRLFDQKRPWERRRKTIPTFKISCGSPVNMNVQPYLPKDGYLGFQQGFPFYPQGYPSYSQGYPEVGIAQQSLPVATQPFGSAVSQYYPSSSVYPGIAPPDYPGTVSVKQQSNYRNPSNPVINSYPNLVYPGPSPAQYWSPTQPQTGYDPSALYNHQNFAGAALYPPAQRPFPASPLSDQPASPQPALPAPPPRAGPARPLHPHPSSASVQSASEDSESNASEASTSFRKKNSASKGPKSAWKKPKTTGDEGELS